MILGRSREQLEVSTWDKHLRCEGGAVLEQIRTQLYTDLNNGLEKPLKRMKKNKQIQIASENSFESLVTIGGDVEWLLRS